MKLTKRFRNTPDVARGHQYALDVVAGVIPAAKHHRLACERHVADMEREKDWSYGFNAEEAQRCCDFLQLLVHVKGKWAGKPVVLESWQCFIVMTMFGWQDKVTGIRRFTEAYLCIPRKNGKSFLVAGIGLLMLTMDGEAGAEVYCGATTQRQSMEVFGAAKMMAQQTPDFKDMLGVSINANSLVMSEDNSRFVPVVRNPGDGSSPHCYILDERHEHPNDDLYETATTGTGAREQPFVISITTAGSTIGGVCYRQERTCKKVLEKVHDDEKLFVMIFGIDDGDDWTSEEALVKANPNINVSVSLDFLKSQQKKAMMDAGKTNAFKTKHLNQWVGAQTAWMDMLAWNKCADEKLTLADFEGKDCIFAIDLASKRDFACYLKLFPVKRDGRIFYYVFPEFFLPEETIQNDRENKLAVWVLEDWLISTSGKEIDFDVIQDRILADAERFNFTHTAYDPWQAQQFATNMGKAGIEMTKFGNGPSVMSEPMGEVLSAAYAGRIIHNGNPIMDWMMSNVVAKTSDNGDTNKPIKESADQKIDGPVCLIMAVGASMNDPVNEPKVTVFAERGVREL